MKYIFHFGVFDVPLTLKVVHGHWYEIVKVIGKVHAIARGKCLLRFQNIGIQYRYYIITADNYDEPLRLSLRLGIRLNNEHVIPVLISM